MKTIYFILYYRILRFALLGNKAEYYAAISAAMALGLLLYLNITYILHLFDYHLYDIRPFGIILLVLFVGLNILIFVKNKNYLKIIEKYKNETKWHKYLSSILTTTYVIVSFFIILLK